MTGYAIKENAAPLSRIFINLYFIFTKFNFGRIMQLNNQHCIAVRTEPVTFFQGLFVSLHDFLISAECSY